MNHNPPSYGRDGLPWAGLIAGAALEVNAAVNDQTVAHGRVPPWPRRHPVLYVALAWVGCALGLGTAAFVLYSYAVAGMLLIGSTLATPCRSVSCRSSLSLVQMSALFSRVEASPERLVIRGWRPIEQVVAGLFVLYLASQIAVDPHHNGSGARLQAYAVWVALAFALWRGVRTEVIVDARGVAYRGFMRNRKIEWGLIDGFEYSVNGVTVLASGRSSVWLVPTKPIKARRDRAIAQAEATLRSIVARAPQEDGFVVHPPQRR
jgi:hypothetical protein